MRALLSGTRSPPAYSDRGHTAPRDPRLARSRRSSSEVLHLHRGPAPCRAATSLRACKHRREDLPVAGISPHGSLIGLGAVVVQERVPSRSPDRSARRAPSNVPQRSPSWFSYVVPESAPAPTGTPPRPTSNEMVPRLIAAVLALPRHRSRGCCARDSMHLERVRTRTR